MPTFKYTVQGTGDEEPFEREIEADNKEHAQHLLEEEYGTENVEIRVL